MTKKILALLIITPFLIFGFISSIYSNKNNPPVGQTGAPTEPSCGFGTSTNTCHGSLSGGNPVSELLTLNTDVELQIGGVAIANGFEYVPDSTYSMTLKINNPTSLCGFSMTAKNNGNGASGSWSIPSGSQAKLSVSNSSYINQNGQAGVSQWDFNWTAPAVGNGDITLYASINKSNNNDAWSGDKIIPFRLELSEKITTGINNVKNISNTLSVKGNPILNNNLALEILVNEPKQYFISVYDLTGKKVYSETKTFHSGIKDVNINLEQKGMYILNIKTNKNESATLKIMN